MSVSIITPVPKNRTTTFPAFRFRDSILSEVESLIKKIEQTLSDHKRSSLSKPHAFNFDTWVQQSGLSMKTGAILRAKELISRETLEALTPGAIVSLGLPLGQKRLLELAVALLKDVPVTITPRFSTKPSARGRCWKLSCEFFSHCE